MESWITFWGAVLMLTLIVYSGLVLYVTVGGFSDIKKMFHSLSINSKERTDDDKD